MYETRIPWSGGRWRDFAPVSSMRATRKGRWRAWGRPAGKIGLVVLLLAMAGLVFARVAMGNMAPATDQIVVRTGDSLWSIAEARYPDTDPRAKVEDIERANHLNGPVLHPGQVLRLPAS
jgi:nucleoid-associated protein YgaU